MLTINNPTLEVYSMFVNYKGETILLVGEVDPETYEYYLGCRFYDHYGAMYHEDGNILCEDPTRKLRRPANQEEIDSFKGMRERVALEYVMNHPHFTNVNEIPDFKMLPELEYSDRMGFMIRPDHRLLYSDDGKAIGSTLPSMRDVLYEIDRNNLKLR